MINWKADMKGDSIPIPNSIKRHLKALSILLSLAKESFFFFLFQSEFAEHNFCLK